MPSTCIYIPSRGLCWATSASLGHVGAADGAVVSEENKMPSPFAYKMVRMTPQFCCINVLPLYDPHFPKYTNFGPLYDQRG